MPKNFVTKLNKKQNYEGGATRDSAEGKGRYDLIPPLALKRVAGVYERGAKNHGDRNWESGIPFHRLLDSALRHINQYREGLVDEDHIGHAVWNLLAVLHFDEVGRTDLNDLPNYQYQSKEATTKPQ